MSTTVKLKRGSGSDPSASDMVVGEPVIRTDTAELFFKKDDGSVAKVSGGGGGPDFKYLALRNAANDGSASYPGNDFTLVTSGTTTAVSPAAANTLLVSYGGVIQRPNSGTSTSGITGFIIDGSRFKTATNLAAAPDFILYQESGGIGEPSDGTVTEAKLSVSNNPTNGYFLSAQSGNTGGLTWAAVDLTALSASNLTSGTVPDARFPATLPAVNGSALTNLNASNIASGTIAAARVATLNQDTTGSAATLTTSRNFSLTGEITASDTGFNGSADCDIATTVADNVIDEANLKVSNSPTNGYFLSAQSGNTGGLTWATVPAGVGGATGVDFNDNVNARWGTGNDLAIYHDGSNSYLTNATADLRIRSGYVKLQGSNGEDMLIGNQNTSVELYYDNSKKFETTSSGAKVTGVATVSNGIVETAATIATNHTITSNYNAMSAGPVTVSATVTVPSGAAWVIV